MLNKETGNSRWLGITTGASVPRSEFSYIVAKRAF